MNELWKAIVLEAGRQLNDKVVVAHLPLIPPQGVDVEELARYVYLRIIKITRGHRYIT